MMHADRISEVASRPGESFWPTGPMLSQDTADATDALVIVVDSGGSVRSMNAPLRAVLSAASGVSGPAHGVGHAVPAVLAALPLRRAAVAGTEHRDVSLVLRGADGAERRVLWTVTPLYDGGGAPCGAVGVGHAPLPGPVTPIPARAQMAQRAPEWARTTYKTDAPTLASSLERQLAMAASCSVDPTRYEHLVQFYDTDAFLLDAVGEFVGAALRAGDSGIVMATPAHREGLEDRLRAHGLDVAAARAEGRYVARDAAETLARVMVDGAPEPGRFTEVIGDIVARAATCGRRVRVFGEMVALLAAQGDHAAAMGLEELWSALQETHPFALLCAYPLACLDGAGHAAFVGEVCAAHARVVPAESYTALDDPNDRLRAIAVQQQARALEVEVAERRRAEADAALWRLRVVQSISDVALANLSSADLLRELLTRLIHILDVDNAAILIPTGDGQELLLHLARGPEEQIAGQVRVPLGQGIAGTIAATRQPLVVDDLRTAEVANPFLKQTIRSLMGIPLVVADRLVGVLHAGTAASRHFTEDDLLLLRLAGDRIALALEHARLYEEEQLHRAEAEGRAAALEAVFEAITDGVFVFGPDGEVQRCNTTARDLFGMDAPPADAQPLQAGGKRGEVWDAQGRPLPRAQWPLFRVLSGEVLTGESAAGHVIHRRNGVARELSISGAPIRDAREVITGAVCVVRDVTERRRMEARILAERNRLQQVLDALPEGIVIADARPPAVVAMNRAATELLGLDLVGRPVPIPPPGADGEYAARRPDGTPYPIDELPLERALLRGEVVRGDQFRIRNATSGREVAILANSAPLRDVGGSVDGAVEVFQDIGALKELERQREAFLAMVSHDLKNPLTAILGTSQLLELRARRLAGSDQARLCEGLGTIMETARGMARQIDELLDITQVRMGRPLQLELAPTDVVGLVARLVEEYQRTTEQHSLHLQHEPDTLVGLVDAARLRRALANLLVNAIKYSPRGGEIRTVLACSEDHGERWLTIGVADQGVGIPPAEVDRVFEGFYRASNVTGRFTGTGLGLTGVRQIVEQHGGTVALESREGAGTVVTVRLPLPRPPSGHAPGRGYGVW